MPERSSEVLYDEINEALKRGDYQQALVYCQAMAERGDFKCEALYKKIRNVLKDINIEKNIKLFAAEYNKTQPKREDVLWPEVIVPCYNQGRFLRDALESVPEGISVTVINDASNDNTAEEIACLMHDYQFKLITNEVNLNQAGSINRAVSESEKNLFVVLNADDALVSYAIPAIIDVFKCFDSVRMVGGGCITFEESSQLKRRSSLPRKLPYIPKPRIYFPSDALKYRQPNDINMTMSSCSFLRSAWEAVGGLWKFERRVCSFDDRDFQMRTSALFPVAVLEEPLAYYRTSSSVGRGRCN
ncbi:MAG: glycosyltransferase family 2 protein [Firmicutes bacterium]|nr:glycosyltransferase family 2 protein [Bacillota bacterium]